MSGVAHRVEEAVRNGKCQTTLPVRYLNLHTGFTHFLSANSNLMLPCTVRIGVPCIRAVHPPEPSYMKRSWAISLAQANNLEDMEAVLEAASATPSF